MKKSQTKSKLAKEITHHADALLSGVVYSFDPSSGSKGSLPGFAYWFQGKLLDFGCLKIPPGTRAANQRLFLLRQALSALPSPNLVITEHISTGFNGFSISKPLIHSVGVIMSQWDVPVLEVAPATWQSHIDKERYVKSDPQDAVSIYCAARRVLQSELGYDLSDMIYISGELKNV